MIQLKFGLVVAALLLGSCNTVRGAAAEPPPPPPPPPPAIQTCPDGSVILATDNCPRPHARYCPDGSRPRATQACPTLPAAYVPVGHLIEKGTSFVPEGGGYAIVLVKPGKPARSQQACTTMMRSMNVSIGPADGRPVRMDGITVFQRPVYWPVKAATPVNCARMLRNYDFERAAANLQRVPHWSRLGQGPFVLVRKANGNQAGLFDFSNVAGADFGKQFSAVVDYMSQRADVWDPGFYHQATFKENLRRYILEETGNTLVLASLVNLRSGDHA